MEEQILRCNVQSQTRGYCRARLRQSAIVTTCSHVICRQCAQETGFLQASPAQRQCPACRNPLPKRDDAVEAILSPTDEYKTTVLSGLDPQTIMECASHALSFWKYQAHQETAYQKHLLCAMTQKYEHTNTELDRIMNEANAEINKLQNQITCLANNNRDIYQRHVDYTKKDQERSKKYDDLRHMYDNLKQKYQAIQQQGTASGGARQAIQNLTEGTPPITQSPYHIRGALVTTKSGTVFADGKLRNFQNAGSLHQHVDSVNPSTNQSRGMQPPQTIPVRGGISQIRNSPVQRDIPTRGMRSTSNRSGISPQRIQQFYASPKVDTFSNRQQLNARPSSISGTPNRYGGIFAGVRTGGAFTLDSHLGHFTDHRRPRSRGEAIRQHRHTGSLSTNGTFQ